MVFMKKNTRVNISSSKQIRRISKLEYGKPKCKREKCKSSIKNLIAICKKKKKKQNVYCSDLNIRKSYIFFLSEHSGANIKLELVRSDSCARETNSRLNLGSRARRDSEKSF